ncbi:unnamed protein product [Musa acuminata subsp. burmannicoides]|uniref:Uncharacterized protein n=1 Tax=Musa acuminata subsp. malaccensis TaxID=214687 RepID=A0A804HV64_MUSAM
MAVFPLFNHLLIYMISTHICIIFLIAFAKVLYPCIEVVDTCVLSINKCTEVTFRAARWNANKRQEHGNISPAIITCSF